jgi:hypothetical protein
VEQVFRIRNCLEKIGLTRRREATKEEGEGSEKNLSSGSVGGAAGNHRLYPERGRTIWKATECTECSELGFREEAKDHIRAIRAISG